VVSTKSCSLAPVALFVYRRADILPQVIGALRRCPEFVHSECFIFSDGPRDEAAADEVAKVRSVIQRLALPNVQLIESSENRGLARSIEFGVTKLCAEYGRVIVLEDDLIVSPAALEWFNAALKKYRDERRIFQISGHNFDVPTLREEKCGFFVPMITSWGWATWDRAWTHYSAEGDGWSIIRNDREQRRDFDLNGNYPYARMMDRQLAGEIDSWAIRWYLSVYRQKGLALFPPRTLIRNVGTDDAATHRGLAGRLRQRLGFLREPFPASRSPSLPEEIAIDKRKFDRLKRSIFWRTSKLSPMYWLTK